MARIRNHLKPLIFALLIIVCWLISLKLMYLKSQKEKAGEEYHYESPVKQDTVVKLWEFKHFQFYVKKITQEGAYPDDAFATVHMNSNDKSYFLFHCHPAITDAGAEPNWQLTGISVFGRGILKKN